MSSAGCTQYRVTCDAFEGHAPVLGQSQPSSTPGYSVQTTNHSGPLPLTGFEVLLVVAGGLIALAAGLWARRGSKAPAQSSD